MNRIAGVLFLGCQLMMLWEATEDAIWPVALGVLAVAMWAIPTRWRGSTWLVGGAAAVAIIAISIAQAFHPIRLTPGQNRWSLYWGQWGLGIQLSLLLSRKFSPLLMAASGMATIYALSVLDFQGYVAFSMGWALMAVMFAVVCVQAWRAQNLVDGRSGSLGMLGILVAIVISGALISTAVSKQMPVVRRWVASQLSLSTRHVVRREVGFSVDGWIGEVSKQIVTDPLTLALTVESNQAPGYLRARAFDSFTGKRWLPVRPERRVDAKWPDDSAPTLGRRVFALQPAVAPWRRITIECAEELRGLFFIPNDTAFLEAHGDRMLLDRNGSILRAAPALRYSAYVGRMPTQAPAPTDQRLVEVPSSIDPLVGQLARKIVGNATNDTRAIAAVTTYLRTQFEYSLDPFQVPRDTDATSHFLLTQQAAHCEYFATGTVALLRHLGIPCRYVTGFLTTEMEDDRTWKARNQDAHAWVEAYDRNLKRWVTVDSTPGSGLDTDESLTSEALEGAGAGDDSGETGSTWWAYFGSLFQHPLSVAGMLGCVVLLVGMLRRMSWRSVDPLVIRRRWLDRQLSRSGLRRAASETLHQFSARILQSNPDNEWLQRAAQWQTQYACVRFGDAPSDSLDDPKKWQKKKSRESK